MIDFSWRLLAGKGRWKSRLPDILAALEALGRARRLDDGRWLG